MQKTENPDTDPKKFGPGIWFLIHHNAALAITQRKKEDFEEFMRDICANLPCLNCRSHCGDYLSSHGMGPYWNKKDENGRDIGLFVWSYEFHNAVNKRLGKPLYSYDTAYGRYVRNDNAVCSATCGQGSSSHDSSSSQQRAVTSSVKPVPAYTGLINPPLFAISPHKSGAAAVSSAVSGFKLPSKPQARPTRR